MKLLTDKERKELDWLVRSKGLWEVSPTEFENLCGELWGEKRVSELDIFEAYTIWG